MSCTLIPAPYAVHNGSEYIFLAPWEIGIYSDPVELHRFQGETVFVSPKPSLEENKIAGMLSSLKFLDRTMPLTISCDNFDNLFFFLDVIMSKLDRRRKGVFGPAMGKKCLGIMFNLNIADKYFLKISTELLL